MSFGKSLFSLLSQLFRIGNRKMKNTKWLEQLNKDLPPKDDILAIMKWHIKTSKLIEGEAPAPALVIDMTTVRYPQDELFKMDETFFRSLDYPTIAKIETAVLIGRELWYGSNSQYQEELNTIPLTDLEQWAEVLSVPLTEASGGNIAEAVDYTLSKRPEIWQAYVDAVS